MTPSEPAGHPPLETSLREVLGVARQALRTEIKRLKRLLDRLAVDAIAAGRAPELREQGEVLKVQLHKVPRGADRVVLAVPWEPERSVAIDLKRELSAAGNLERLFRRARGLEQGLRIIAARRAEAEARQTQVCEVITELDSLLERGRRFDATDASDDGAPAVRPGDALRAARSLRERVAALRLRVGVPPSPTTETRRVVSRAGGQLPEGVQLFSSPGGATVLAGRSAHGNDALVTRLLRGRDLWLHVRDRTGAHVVLRIEGKAPPDEAEVRACAVLAAHLSGVGKGEAAEVQCVGGKHVRKVKGTATGSVYVDRGRTVRVTVEASVVDAFYQRRPPPE